MDTEISIAHLIHKGGVYADVEGSSPEEIYKKISGIIPLPKNISPDAVYKALCERERVMSTAVGNEIALPHAQHSILKSKADEAICVVYLKNPIDMHAPDDRFVSVMFVLLTHDAQSHLKILSMLATLLRKDEFKKLLESHANESVLLDAAEKIIHGN
ncbi:MAG: PTS sugar transporter subunit IIA [Treponema sp.]|nr:PTS sugar transporter subunit IIA [Treponema sp.]